MTEHLPKVEFVRTDPARATPAGWRVRCSCGWASHRVNDNNYAKALHSGHVAGTEKHL